MRAIHARLFFLTVLLMGITTLTVIYTVLIPYLQSLIKTATIQVGGGLIEPIPIDVVYDRDCRIAENTAIMGYAIAQTTATSPKDCMAQCVSYNQANIDVETSCDFWSFHSDQNLDDDQKLVGESDELVERACNFISGMSAVRRSYVKGAFSGVSECIMTPICLHKMRGVMRTGDTLHKNVKTPQQCEKLCQEASAVECLYWTIYSSNQINIGDTAVFDTCILHRATKPNSARSLGSDSDEWPIQVMKTVPGTSLVSGRVCSDFNQIELTKLQNQVYELYGMQAPNRTIELGKGTTSDKFAPSQDQLETWFYENTERDGGPFPMDSEPVFAGTNQTINKTCPYGLSKWFTQKDLFNFLGADWGRTHMTTDGTVIITPDAVAQGHVKPFGQIVPTEDTEAPVFFSQKLENIQLQGLDLNGLPLRRHDGLWVISLKHVPVGCGIRRTIKLKSSGDQSAITVMDSHNYLDYYKMNLQTTKNCDMSLPYLMGNIWHPFLKPHQRGAWSRHRPNEEASRQLWNCKAPNSCDVESRIWRNGVPEPIYGSGGVEFNTGGGGVIVVQVDRARAIKIWNFAPEDVPQDLVINAPDPASWSVAPTRTISGVEKYLAPMAMFSLVRGCESMAGCEDVLQCPDQLDVCPEYMRDLHVQTILTADGSGRDIAKERLINGYFPVGCHGFQNFHDMHLEFGLSFCDDSSSHAWTRDPACSNLKPLQTPTAFSPSLIDQCIINHKDNFDLLLKKAFWEIYEVRLYEKGAPSCYHENLIQLPVF